MIMLVLRREKRQGAGVNLTEWKSMRMTMLIGAYVIFIHFQSSHFVAAISRVSNKIVAKRRQRDTKWLFPGA